MDHYTCYHYAAYHDNWKLIELLLQLGADPLVTTKSKLNSLHVATQEDNIISMAILL